MKLYDTQTAPNPRIVRIFLAEKGIDIPQVHVDLAGGEHKTPEFLAKNPSGTVPVLELDDGNYMIYGGCAVMCFPSMAKTILISFAAG
jgi:glutathione S-transferase